MNYTANMGLECQMGQDIVQLVAAQSPILFFSDLVDGPRSGNSDTSQGQPAGTHGAIVTIWGKYLGSSQGTSKVYCGGVEAPVVYTWSDATEPANLYASHGMQMIAFQIAGTTPLGDQTIHVVVDGQTSNDLPFHVRDTGAIIFVSTSGTDGDGRGSWTSPFRTIINSAYDGAFNKMEKGDIVYALDGVTATAQVLDGCIDTQVDGAYRMSSALIGYPGATVNVGSDDCNAVRTFVSGIGYTTHWTIAKLNIVGTIETGIPMYDGWRVIGNRFECKKVYDAGQSGIIAGSGNNLTAAGNELLHTAQTNAATVSKLEHVLYFQSERQEEAPRLPTEYNKVVAWNYFHDNYVYCAVNFYSEGTNSGYFEENYIHDNVIINQRGAGILAGPYITGNENYIYNNMIYNAGLGPEGPEGCSGQIGLQIFVGWTTGVETTIYVYSNTVVDSGFLASTCGFTGAVYFAPYPNARIVFHNNIISQDPSFGPLVLIDDPQQTPSGADYQNNLWYGQEAPSWDQAAVTDDPLFVDLSSYNFHLQANSPAIGAGIDTRDVAAFDLEGLPRPSTPDLGAYQYAAAPPGGWYVPPVAGPGSSSPSGSVGPTSSASPSGGGFSPSGSNSPNAQAPSSTQRPSLASLGLLPNVCILMALCTSLIM